MLLLINKDIIPNNLKKLINHGFLIHPEELVGYLIGNIKSIIKKSDANTEISLAKQNYSNNQASNLLLFFQYLSAIGILIALINPTSRYEIIIIGSALFIWGGRIFLNYLQYKKLPNIPILYELRSIIIK